MCVFLGSLGSFLIIVILEGPGPLFCVHIFEMQSISLISDLTIVLLLACPDDLTLWCLRLMEESRLRTVVSLFFAEKGRITIFLSCTTQLIPLHCLRCVFDPLLLVCTRAGLPSFIAIRSYLYHTLLSLYDQAHSNVLLAAFVL